MKKILLLWGVCIVCSVTSVFATDASVDQLLDIVLNGTGTVAALSGSDQKALVTTGVTTTPVKAVSSPVVVAPAAPIATQVATPIVTQDDEFAAALGWMYTKWLTQYSSAKSYSPDMKLTRQQAAKFFVNMQEIVLGKIPVSSVASCTFNDSWFDSSLRPYVDKACTYGIMQGNNGKFRPNATISKPEFVASLIRMIEWAKRDESKNPRWISYYEQARDWNLTKEKNALAFDTDLTRYEAALFLYRSLPFIQSSTVDSAVTTPSDTTTSGENTTWTVTGDTATDVPSNAHITSLIADPALQEAIFWMHDNGMTKYTSVESFRPYDTITRAEAAKIFSAFRATVLPNSSASTGAICSYADINTAEASLVPYIVDACSAQIFKWGTWLFQPLTLLTKPQAVAILVRLLEWPKDETTNPRWTAYYKRAVELSMIQDSAQATFDKPITRYEIAILLYNTKVEQNIMKNLNSNVESSKLIFPVPGSIGTGNTWEIQGLISLNTQMLNANNTDVYTVDLFGDQYKIEKSATQKYLANDYVWYGKMLSLDQTSELGTVVFTISNGVIIDGVIRPYKVSPQTLFSISPSTQQPYYTMIKKTQ